jgi:hypothetical protein
MLRFKLYFYISLAMLAINANAQWNNSNSWIRLGGSPLTYDLLRCQDSNSFIARLFGNDFTWAPSGETNVTFNTEQFARDGLAVSIQPGAKLTNIINELDVRMYGAWGNGTSNDLDAIQTALDASGGRPVYLPKGIYKCNSMLVLPNVCNMYGDDPTNTIIYFDDDFVRPTGGYNFFGVRNVNFSSKFNPDTADSFNIRNIQFQVNQTTNNTSYPFNFANARNSLLENCWFILNGTATNSAPLGAFAAYRNIIIRRNVIRNNTGTLSGGLWLNGNTESYEETNRSENITIEYNDVEMNSSADVFFIGAWQGIIDGVNAHHNRFVTASSNAPNVAIMGSDNIATAGSIVRNVKFHHNTIIASNCTYAGLKIGMFGILEDSEFSYNIIRVYGSAANGIAFQNTGSSRRIITANNNIAGATGVLRGIYNAGTNTFVVNNYIHGDFLYGSIGNCYGIVKENVIQDNSVGAAIFDSQKVFGNVIKNCKYSLLARNATWGDFYFDNNQVFDGPATLGNILIDREFTNPRVYSRWNGYNFTNSSMYVFDGTNGTILTYYDVVKTSAGSLNPSAVNVTVTESVGASSANFSELYATNKIHMKGMLLDNSAIDNTLYLYPKSRQDSFFRIQNGPSIGTETIFLIRKLTNGGITRLQSYAIGGYTNGPMEFGHGSSMDKMFLRGETNGNAFFPFNVGITGSLNITNGIYVNGTNLHTLAASAAGGGIDATTATNIAEGVLNTNITAMQTLLDGKLNTTTYNTGTNTIAAASSAELFATNITLLADIRTRQNGSSVLTNLTAGIYTTNHVAFGASIDLPFRTNAFGKVYIAGSSVTLNTGTWPTVNGGQSITYFIQGTNVPCTVTLNASWNLFGVTNSVFTLPANKKVSIQLYKDGSTESDVYASYCHQSN